jgi:hypothetical protein
VNAAFLLVTTAWFAGDTGAPCASCAAPACGTACATSSCDCSGPKLLDRLKALCQKNTCDTCAAPKCAPPPKCAPACAPACDTCSSGPKLLDRLKALCHKDKCDTCATGSCSTCGAAAEPAPAPKAGEPIPAAPKKMPNPVGAESSGREVRISTPGQAAPVIENNAGQAPAAIAPSFSDNLRNPF